MALSVLRLTLKLFTMSYLIDWVTCKQTHHHLRGQLPVVDGGLGLSVSKIGEIIEFFDDDRPNVSDKALDYKVKDGYKLDWATMKKLNIKGSHDTSIQFFCDGSTTFFSANVGRYGRGDNVFNLDINSTFDKINEIIAKKFNGKIPPFAVHESERFERTNVKDKGYETLYNCPEITRLDITRNYLTGSPENAKRMLRHLETKSMSHVKRHVVCKGRSGSPTIYWGDPSGGRRVLKAYIKAIEMLDHCKSKKKRHTMELSQSYLFCHYNGLLRVELQLDNRTLSERNLRLLKDITMEKLIAEHEERAGEIINAPMIDLHNFDFDDLPKALCRTAMLWVKGEDPLDTMSRAQWYVHAKKLRAFGIDIAIPYANAPEKATIEIRPIILTPAVRPIWYSLDADLSTPKPQLRVVNQ